MSKFISAKQEEEILEKIKKRRSTSLDFLNAVSNNFSEGFKNGYENTWIFREINKIYIDNITYDDIMRDLDNLFFSDVLNLPISLSIKNLIKVTIYYNDGKEVIRYCLEDRETVIKYLQEIVGINKVLFNKNGY